MSTGHSGTGTGTGTGTGAGAPAAEAVAAAAGPPAAITSFAQLFQLPGQDAYNGNYAGVLNSFSSNPTGTGWSAVNHYTAAFRVDPDQCNCWVGLFSRYRHGVNHAINQVD